MFNNYQDVIVSPTAQQISNATEQIVFNQPVTEPTNEENNTRSRCPITLEEFTDGETVTRIRHCGHTFQETAITNWFNSNVRCPVCRYDIRDWTSQSDVSGNPTEEPNENQPASPRINTLISELTNGLNNAMQTYINTEYNRDSINNYELYPDTAVYTFTIPLTYQESIDISNSINPHTN